MGGILADVGVYFNDRDLRQATDIQSYVKDMGLGKTLSTFALICSSLDLHANTERFTQSQGYRRTLIVAPKSGKFTQE